VFSRQFPTLRQTVKAYRGMLSEENPAANAT
jgi:hypothetical protein